MQDKLGNVGMAARGGVGKKPDRQTIARKICAREHERA